jgi:hypothetical protein
VPTRPGLVVRSEAMRIKLTNGPLLTYHKNSKIHIPSFLHLSIYPLSYIATCILIWQHLQKK